MDNEQMEQLKRAVVWSYRIDQFFWGWCWFGVVDQGFKLTGMTHTESSPWLHLVLFVTSALLAIYFGRKVKAVGMSISFK